MNLHRAIVAVFLSQVVQGHVSHPAADSAKSPQKPDEELTEDEAAVAKLTEDDQASAASAQAGVHDAVPWKGVGAETIDVGVIVSSSAARRDRRRQMKDGKRTSSMVSQKGTKNRRLQGTHCDRPANTFSFGDISFDLNFDSADYRIEVAPPGFCIEFSACHDYGRPYYNSGYGGYGGNNVFLGLYLSGRVDDAADPYNCEYFGYVEVNDVDCRDAISISNVVRLELEVATNLTLNFYGYGDFEVTTSKCKSSKSAKSQIRK